MAEAVSYENIKVSPGYQIPDAVLPVLNNFDGILGVPRKSKKEELIRAHLLEWAESKGFEYKIDKIGNIAINIPATVGHEDKTRVILQGHMDMVTEGGNDKTATKAKIDEKGWMSSESGKTTLGADNGIGLAMAMALAEDEELTHGPLTLLMTVDEETGLTGAGELDPSIIPEGSAILINMDSEEGHQFICNGSAGGMDVVGRFDISKKTEVPEDYQEIEINVKGLRGGHSGDEIHEERGNAIIMLNTILLQLQAELEETDEDFKLIEYSGGNVRNSIPRLARCRIAIPESAREILMDLMKQFASETQTDPAEELNLSAANTKDLGLSVAFEIIRRKDLRAISDEVRDKLLQLIGEIPDGSDEATGGFKGGVLVSSNLGVLGHPKDDEGNVTDENILELGVLVRAAESNKLDALATKIGHQLWAAGAARVERSGEYGGWLEPDDSVAVALAVEAAREAFGEPTVFAYHAGLESSVIKERLKGRADISAVSMGPRIRNPHGPEEETEVDSVDKVYRTVRTMLQNVV